MSNILIKSKIITKKHPKVVIPRSRRSHRNLDYQEIAFNTIIEDKYNNNYILNNVPHGLAAYIS